MQHGVCQLFRQFLLSQVPRLSCRGTQCGPLRGHEWALSGAPTRDTPYLTSLPYLPTLPPYLTSLAYPSQGFTEIHTPKLVGTASEGGADVFAVEYFGRKAYLAQSPQLYKQMALMADLERVFEVAPVFRSENSLTHRHMCEFVGLDMEMCFHEHYSEVLDMMDRTFNAVFDGLNSEYASEQAATRP